MRALTYILDLSKRSTRVFQPLTHSRMFHSFVALTILMIVFAGISQIRAQSSDTQPVPLPTAASPEDGTSSDSSLGSRNNTSPATTGTTDTLSLPGSADTRACTTYGNPVQLAWFYNPPQDGTSITALASNFDTHVLTKNFEDDMEELQAKGEAPVLQYLAVDSIHDPCQQAKKAVGTPCSCDKNTLNNNVGWFSTDVCTIRDEHPDWFLRDKNGNLIYNGTELIMDPGNQGWREFYLSRIKTSQAEGWDGIFLDNLATDFGAHRGDTDIQLQKYPTDDDWRAAMTGFLKYINDGYLESNNKKLYGNVAVYWKETAFWLNYADHMDGGQDEFWAYPREGYYSLLSWEERLLRWEETLKRGDRVILVAQGSKSDYNRQRFGLASYLLIAGPNTFFRYTSQSAYSQVWLYDNYKAPLGNPLGAYTRKENSKGVVVFIRKFENGKVKVKPDKKTANIKLYDADGTVCN